MPKPKSYVVQTTIELPLAEGETRPVVLRPGDEVTGEVLAEHRQGPEEVGQLLEQGALAEAG